MAQVNHLSYPRLMCPPVIWQRIRRLSRDIQDSQYILRQPGRAGLGLGGFRVRLVWIAEETILDGGGCVVLQGYLAAAGLLAIAVPVNISTLVVLCISAVPMSLLI